MLISLVWLIWLGNEKHYSPHTTSSYCNDLVSFFKFLNIYNNTQPNIETIDNISINDGGKTKYSEGSTIVDLTNPDKVKILRKGVVINLTE